jgi:acetylornithine deacetylase/succinyl-diaminopimelate desuccinylase-like protein
MKSIPIHQRVLELAITIQQTPAPTFEEQSRRELIHRLFDEEGLVDISVDGVGNVYARLPGKSARRPIVVSAHLDTVFPIETELDIVQSADQVTGPGIGDNSMGLAGLFGIIWNFRSISRLENDIWFVANVGEEGLGDLCGMKAVVARFQDQVKAYLVLEGMAYGTVYYRGLGVRRYRISTHTPGGHSWVNFGRPSAIHELSDLVTRIQDIELPETPRTSYNVGTIQGGTSVNTIASHASMDLDLRSESKDALDNLDRKIQSFVQQGQKAGENFVEYTVSQIGNRPMGEIPLDHPLVKLACRVLEDQGINPRLEIGSTDANIPLSKGLPAICLGVTNGHGAHTLGETIDTAPIEKGLEQIFAVVSGADQMPG